MTYYVSLYPSKTTNKKYTVIITQTPATKKRDFSHKDKTKVVRFGAKGYSDFTQTPATVRRRGELSSVPATKSRDFIKHKNELRKFNYIKRHKTREKWSIGGIFTAGFWSRWILWNKPTIGESKKDIEKRFNIKFVN